MCNIISDFINLPEQEIYNNILLYNDSLQTNCESASMDLYIVVANACYSKKSIIHSLVRVFTRPLYYLGVEKSQDVITWIKWFLDYKKTGKYVGKINFSNDSALEWFFERLNENKTHIEECLEELKACNQLQDIYLALKKDENGNCFKYTDNIGKVYCFTEFKEFKEFVYKFFEKRVSKLEVEKLITEEIDFFIEKFDKAN